MRVIDPAAGSGHFLLAAARQMGRELARMRTGEEEPPPTAFRTAVRDVIRECIHAVDKNPLAVDLCKVALWIEGHNAGQPLSFLDHHIKCGDSLVRVFDLNVLTEGIPDDAYKAVEGDDKAAAKHYRQLNRETKRNHPTLPQLKLPANVVAALEALSHRDERTPEDVSAKEQEYGKLINSPAMQNLENACDAWVAAFFVPLRMAEFLGRDLVPTSGTVWERLSGRQIYGLLDAESPRLRPPSHSSTGRSNFLTSLLGAGLTLHLVTRLGRNFKAKNFKWFARRALKIAEMAGSARKAAILALSATDHALAKGWEERRHSDAAITRFVKQSRRYRLTGVGKFNSYALFSELFYRATSQSGRCGLIVPSGRN
jgi:hypothetical protein